MKCRCGNKCRFKNFRAAHLATTRICLEGGPKMRPYKCFYGSIHITSQRRTRDAYLPEMQEEVNNEADTGNGNV